MNITTRLYLILIVTFTFVFTARGQAPTFSAASDKLKSQLDSALAELSKLREDIAAEKIPLGRQLSDLESQLSETRKEFQETSRTLDSRTLDLTNLRNEIKAREDEAGYLSNLFSEYGRNLESGLHIAELQRMKDSIDKAKLAPENTALSVEEVYEIQAGLLTESIERLHDVLGGTEFKGSAVDAEGVIHNGTFKMIGPAGYFVGLDGKALGTAEQRLGSLEPTIIEFRDPLDAEQGKGFLSGGSQFPLDPTLGNAHVIQATEETFVEHIQKGGEVVYPIFLLAGAALLVALFKWISLLFVAKPSQAEVKSVIDAVATQQRPAVESAVKNVRGPAGKMLTAAVADIEEPRELIEEVMFEKLLITRLKLNRMLPFIAVSGAAAPLLGLLGTVTGIINTFKLITVFGTGDVKTLSGGISEALITTELGLIVAIPSLLIHAYLSRKAKGVVDHMEKTGIAFVNQLVRTPMIAAVVPPTPESVPAPAPTTPTTPTPPSNPTTPPTA